MHAFPRKSLFSALLLGAGLFASIAPANAQNVAALTARLEQTAAETTLDAPGTQPWHLKLDLQLYKSNGTPAEQGTVEEWWADKSHYRIAYTTASLAGSELRVNDKVYRTPSMDLEPPIFENLLDEVVHPLQFARDVSSWIPALRKERFGKVELECIMLQPPQVKKSQSFGRVPTFCFDPGQPDLRVAVEFSSLIVSRTRVGSFLGRMVPIDFVTQSQTAKLGSAHISTLSTMKADAMELAPSKTTTSVDIGVSPMQGAVASERIIDKVLPRYPKRAKQAHVSGIVVLRAIIGVDGRVRTLRLISSPDVDLTDAALEATKQWTYKPFLVNGLATEVNTIIVVTFSFG